MLPCMCLCACVGGRVDHANVQALYFTFTLCTSVVHVNTLSDNISTSGRSTIPKRMQGGERHRANCEGWLCLRLMNICFPQIRLNEHQMTGLIWEVSHQHGQSVATPNLTHAAPPSHANLYCTCTAIVRVLNLLTFNPCRVYPNFNHKCNMTNPKVKC